MAEIYDRDQVVENCIKSIQLQLFQRGARSTAQLGRAFKLADFNGNRKLDVEEFEEALSHAGVRRYTYAWIHLILGQIFLKKPEISAVFRTLDRSGDGSIDYDEFLRAIKGDLSERRRNMVNKAFDIMDRDGSGVLTIEDLRGIFNGSKHPDVLAGRITEDQALEEFLNQLDGMTGNNDGSVTREEFIEYYTDVSSAIPTDEYFITMMESVWMVPEGEYSEEELKRLDELGRILREKIRNRSTGGSDPRMRLQAAFKFVDSGTCSATPAAIAAGHSQQRTACTDETGRLTIDEFRNALERMGVPVQRRDVGYLFDMYVAPTVLQHNVPYRDK